MTALIAGSLIVLTALVAWTGMLWWWFLDLKLRQEAFHRDMDRLVNALLINEPNLYLKPRRHERGSLTERWSV